MLGNRSNPTARRIGRTWVFPDGTMLPVVAGGADETGASALGVEVPEDLTTIEDIAELEALADALVGEFDRLHDEGSTDVEALTELADNIDRVRTERTRRETEAAEAAAAVAALADRVHASDEAADGGDDDEDGDDDGDDPGDGDAPAGDAGEGAAAEREPEAVTAGAKPNRAARRASARGTAARSPRATPPAARPQVVITAAAELPGVVGGQVIDLDQVARSMHDRARALPPTHGGVGFQAPVATFAVPNAVEIAEGTGKERAWETITASVEEQVAQLAGFLDRGAAGDREALVAAGGWCVPSEPLFDLFEINQATGLLSLPGIGVPRAGISVPSYIGWDAADGAVWEWTEDDDIDALENDGGETDVTKPCFRIPCPSWTEVRLAAVGLCLTHGNLSNRAFPELTRRYISLAVAGTLRRISARHIAYIRLPANSVAVTIAPGVSDTFGELMSAIELQVLDYRSQHRIADTVPLDLLLPSWTTGVLRANLAMRAGVDLLSVTDQQIMQHLATRGVRAQFIEDYQPLFNAQEGPAVAWPDEVEFLLYPAGGFVAGNGGTLDLGVVRDSSLNAVNDFTAAWTETFALTARRGPLARRATVALNTTGVTGCCVVEPEEDGGDGEGGGDG